MKVKQSISKTYLYSMVTVAIMAVGILGALWISTEYRNFKRESESMRQEYMASMKSLIKNETEKVADYIRFKRSQTE